MKVEIGNYQKNGKRKFDIKIHMHDLYSLFHTLSLIILPCLKKYEENEKGHPANMEYDEWKEILKRMINAFELIAEDNLWDVDEKKRIICFEGLELIGKYFNNLWY